MARVFSTYDRPDGGAIVFFSADKSDANGNRRIIVHFLDFLTDSERISAVYVQDKWDVAKRRAKLAGFREFRGKEFGGGFVAQYDFCQCRDLGKRILDAIQADLSK